MLPEFLQQLGHGKRDVSLLPIILLFVELQQILSIDIYSLNGSKFKYLWLLVSYKNRDKITDVSRRLCQGNSQIRIARTGNAYQKTDLMILLDVGNA